MNVKVNRQRHGLLSQCIRNLFVIQKLEAQLKYVFSYAYNHRCSTFVVEKIDGEPECCYFNVDVNVTKAQWRG